MKRLVLITAVAIVGILFLLPAIQRVAMSGSQQGLVKLYAMDSDKTEESVELAIDTLTNASKVTQDVILTDVDSATPVLNQLQNIKGQWSKVESRAAILTSDLTALEQEAEAMYPVWNDVAGSLDNDQVRNKEMLEYDTSRRDFQMTLSESRRAVNNLQKQIRDIDLMVSDVNKLIELEQYKKAASTLIHRCASISKEAYYAKLNLSQVKTDVQNLFSQPEVLL